MHVSKYSVRRDHFPVPRDGRTTDEFAQWQRGGPSPPIPTAASHLAADGGRGKGEVMPLPKHVAARRQQYDESARRRAMRARQRGEPHGPLSDRAKDILSMTERAHAERAQRAATKAAQDLAQRAREAAAKAKAIEKLEREARREAVRMAAANRLNDKVESVGARAAERGKHLTSRAGNDDTLFTVHIAEDVEHPLWADSK